MLSRKSALKLSALAVLFAAGALLAGAIAAGGRAVDTTTEDTTTAETTTAETTTEPTTTEETTTTTEPTTAPATTVITATTTVQQTTTKRVPLPTLGTTEATSGSGGGTPDWVWVLLGLLAAGLIALIVLLARRGHGNVSVEERQRRLDGTVASWAAQGWAIESQTADSAVLRRGGELMLVSVDPAGHVTTRPLPTS
ncbi:MAG TPA: hypothetical protein VGF23_00415 [Gaiellaceae bacterium]